MHSKQKRFRAKPSKKFPVKAGADKGQHPSVSWQGFLGINATSDHAIYMSGTVVFEGFVAENIY